MAAIFFLFIYGFTAVGNTVYVHYCMNKLMAVSLCYEHKDRCEKCGMKSGKTNGCCKDVTLPLKTDKEYQLGTAQKQVVNAVLFSTFIGTPVCCIGYCSQLMDTPQKPLVYITLPDDPIPIYKKNCTYRV